MTISEVIDKYFLEFKSMVRNPDIMIENGNTMDDIFQNVMVTALKKYEGDVDEIEAYNYIKKTLLTEFHFSFRRKKKDILVFTDKELDVPDE